MACIIVVSTPYFRARFAGAAANHPQLELHSIEMGAGSDTYAFTPDPAAHGYTRHIVSEKPMERQSPAEIARGLEAALDRIKPDVVGLPGWLGPTAFCGMQWCMANAVPAVLMSESTAQDEVRSRWREAVKRRYVGLAAAALAGGSPHADYLAELGMLRDRIFLGYDAVDNGYFAQAAEMVKSGKVTSDTLAANHLSPSHRLPVTPYFLASARFVEKKNLPFLLRAYARYRQLVTGAQVTGDKSTAAPLSPSHLLPFAQRPWPLILLGDGPLRPALNAQLSTLHLHEHVQLPGFIQYPELPRYYAEAGAFIHASTTEQWGLVVNEAMASGLPVLVSNRCGCAPDLVRDGVNGWTFDPANEEQLAELMLRLANLPQVTGGKVTGGKVTGGKAGEVSASQDARPDSESVVSLSALGAASRQIVSQWGPDRFAAGLRQAAECAVRVGPKRAGIVDRALLALLARR